MKTINSKKNTGFTLIELIVTVSIAAIVTSIAVPSFSAMIKSNRVTAATNEVVSALILARSEALKRKNSVSICVSDNQTACTGGSSGNFFSDGWIVFLDCNPDGSFDAAGVDCDGDGATDDADQIIKVHDKISGITIAKADDKSWEGYNYAGRSRGTGTFNIAPESGSTQKQVIVSLSGRVRTVKVP